MLNVIITNTTSVENVILLRFITFGFINAFVKRQCCQICTNINAYHIILTMQWSEPHEALPPSLAEIKDMNMPTINSISTVVFAIRFERILFMNIYVLIFNFKATKLSFKASHYIGKITEMIKLRTEMRNLGN